jgi:hypothetical protein
MTPKVDFEWLDRLVLTTLKVTLLVGAFVAFLPLILGTALRSFNVATQRAKSARSTSSRQRPGKMPRT